MARSRMAVGTHGNIKVTGYADKARTQPIEGTRTKATVWVARTYYRDETGRRRLIEASADTKAKATNALKGKLTDLQTVATNEEWRSDMTVGKAADLWLEHNKGQNLAETTRNLYAGNVARYVKGSSIEHLTLAEANRVARLEGWLQEIADAHGNGSAKGARSVMSNVFRLALRYGVLPHNAMSDVRTPKAKAGAVKVTAKVGGQTKRDTDRMITDTELAGLLAYADADDDAQRLDLADLIAYLAGTGVRINEALGQRWGDVDLTTGEVHVRGTKTEFSDRFIHLPADLLKRLQERADARYGKAVPPADHVLFPSPRKQGHTPTPTKVRNRDTCLKQLRKVFDGAGLPWATSHSFRHMVITKIVAAGHDVGLAADHAGHSDVRTTQAYVTRNRSTRVITAALAVQQPAETKPRLAVVGG